MMGFDILEARQLDDEYHMFDTLNFAKEHPARDGYDTFRTEEGLIPPAHTSTMQHRVLKQFKSRLDNDGVLAVVVPGRVFRNEDVDATHEHTFYQCEGVYGLLPSAEHGGCQASCIRGTGRGPAGGYAVLRRHRRVRYPRDGALLPQRAGGEALSPSRRRGVRPFWQAPVPGVPVSRRGGYRFQPPEGNAVSHGKSFCVNT